MVGGCGCDGPRASRMVSSAPDGLAAPFERITYRDGQRLTARDLGDDRARRTRLRRLHVRWLHETWGIAIGYDVRAADASTVAVGPGYALDIDARERLLASSVSVPVPGVRGPAPFVLAATFVDDAAFAARRDLGGVCLDHPLDPRRERPALVWLTPEQFEPGPVVPLASVVVQNGAISGGVQTRVRRHARRFVRPHFATGVTDPDAPGWTRLWYQAGRYALETVVDTSDAGFTTEPVYFASIVPTASATHTAAETEAAIAQADGHVARADRASFVYRVAVPEPFIPDVHRTWAIAWLGAEPLAGCPPALDLRRLFTLVARLLHPIRL